MRFLQLSFFLFLFLFFSGLSWAHEGAVHPVRVELKVDFSRIRATVKTHVGYWSEFILVATRIPANHWPEGMKKAARDYLNSHFLLFLGGKPLPIDWFDYRYVEELWDARSGGTIIFQGVGDPSLSATGGLGPPSPILSGRSTFFFESLEGVRKNHLPKEIEEAEEGFQTRLNIPGRVPRHFILTPEAPTFEVPLQEVLRTPRQVMEEHFSWGFSQFFVHLSLTFFVMAAVLWSVLQ